MAKVNLDKMSRDELVQLRKDIDKTIKALEERQRKEALAAAEAAAKKKGFSLAQLTGTAPKKPRRSYPPKYRHPENPELTWSGRGRQPAWYREWVEAGHPSADLLI